MVANLMAIAGLGFLAVAMTGVILLVTDVLFDTITTVIASVAVAVILVVLWGFIPVRRRLTSTELICA